MEEEHEIRHHRLDDQRPEEESGAAEELSDPDKPHTHKDAPKPSRDAEAIHPLARKQKEGQKAHT